MTAYAEENETIEFKERPANLEKEIVAFANARGGTIYLGVTDSGQVRPMPLTNRLRSELVNAITNCDPEPPFSIITNPDGVIELRIGEGDSKPYRAPNGFFLRIGATSQKLSRDQILKFFIDENRIQYDRQIRSHIEEASLFDYLNREQFEWFREKSGLTELVSHRSLLENLGLVCPEKDETSRLGITNAAFLLFGREPQRQFPHARTILWLMEGPENILEQKLFNGTLFEQLHEGLRYLRAHLTSRIEISGLQREEHTEFPDFVLRELLLNALVHRDYFEKGAEVQVKIFPRSVEFSNPGGILYHLRPEEIIGKSLRRNPLLAEILQRVGYIERAGTGLLRVQSYLESVRGNLTVCEEGPFFVARLLRLQNQHKQGITPSQQAVIQRLEMSPAGLKTAELASQLGLAVRTVRRDLSELRSLRLVRAEKVGRGVRYYIGER